MVAVAVALGVLLAFLGLPLEFLIQAGVMTVVPSMQAAYVAVLAVG